MIEYQASDLFSFLVLTAITSKPTSKTALFLRVWRVVWVRMFGALRAKRVQHVRDRNEFDIKGFTHFVFERESSVSFSSLHRHLCSTSRELLANCFWKDIPCLCGLKANWSVVSCGKGATTRKSTTRLFCLKPIYASFFFQNKKITLELVTTGTAFFLF